MTSRIKDKNGLSGLQKSAIYGATGPGLQSVAYSGEKSKMTPRRKTTGFTAVFWASIGIMLLAQVN